MYPYYRRAAALTQEDIDAILTMYAAQTSTGPAAPLSLTVQNAVSTTASSSITLTGTAAGGQGPLRVSWASAGGQSGTAVGSAAWTVVGLPLVAGANVITVTVTDGTQATVHQTITISRSQTATQPLVPVLNIVSPVASGAYTSSAATVTVSGTATDASGIARVAWTMSPGSNGQALGTTNWIAGPFTLSPGTTTIVITAYGQSGLMASQTLQISYSPPATPVPSAPPASPPSTPAPTAPGTDTTPPTLTIVSPALTTTMTSSSSLACSGTAKDNVGIASVTWSTSNGDSGVATGAESWKVAAIPLLVGTNTITIKAFDAAGNMTWRSLVVTRH